MSNRDRQQGVTLIELMIAMVLGLVVLGGVTAIFLANRETYRVSEGVNRMQENARYSFEILGRTLREAGGNLCGATRVANVLNNASTTWWANWGNAIRGFESGVDDTLFPKAMGTNVADRVAGTDAVIVITALSNEGLVITEHNPTSAQFKVNTTNHGLRDGDILMACDNNQAAIFQVTNANSNNVTIVHNTGGSVSPGNCSKGLGFPTVCTSNGTPYTFAERGFLARLSSQAWYIGNNPRGGRSLYRLQLTNSNGSATARGQEVVPNVSNLQLAYLTQTGGAIAADYVRADQVDWNAVANGTTKVVAVRLELTTEEPEVRVSGQPLSRTWVTIVQLRNVT